MEAMILSGFDGRGNGFISTQEKKEELNLASKA